MAPENVDDIISATIAGSADIAESAAAMWERVARDRARQVIEAEGDAAAAEGRAEYLEKSRARMSEDLNAAYEASWDARAARVAEEQAHAETYIEAVRLAGVEWIVRPEDDEMHARAMAPFVDSPYDTRYRQRVKASRQHWPGPSPPARLSLSRR